MAELYTNESHFDFSGGVDIAVSRLLMADNELNKVENGELIQIGNIFKVKGYTIRGNAVNQGYNILGMVNAIRASDGTQKQIVVADGASNSDAYTFDTVNNIWTPHHLSLSTGSKAEFESFLNGFYMVNFTDATRFNDLTQWYTTTNVTSAAKAKYIKLYLGRIYLAYVVSGGTTYPSKVTYSDLPNGSPPQTTWNDALNFFDVDTDNGDYITGLEVNASRLMVFKKNSLYLYDTNTLQQVPGCPGTVSQRTVKNIQGHTLYFHNTGLWDFSGSQSTLISRKIQDIVDGVNAKNLSNMCSIVQNDHYYLYLGDINNINTGLIINKCLLDYNIAYQSLTWRSLEDNPLCFIYYPDVSTNITYNQSTLTYNDANTAYNGQAFSNDKLFFGSDNGSVFQFNNSGQQNGQDIAIIIETKDYWLGYPAFFKLMQKVIVFNNYSGQGRLIIQARADDKDWVTLIPSTKDPLEYIFPKNFLCRRVRFRILESSGGKPFAFEGLDIYFTATGLIK